MFEIRVTISCPDLVAAVQALAKGIPAPAPTPAPAESAPAPSPVPANPAPAPTPAPAPVTPPPAPAAPVAPTAPMVPLAQAPSFTLEQVGRAGADLITQNPGKMPELMALLSQFGIQTVQQLKPDQLGAFATALRGMGAKI